MVKIGKVLVAKDAASSDDFIYECPIADIFGIYLHFHMKKSSKIGAFFYKLGKSEGDYQHWGAGPSAGPVL